MFMVNKLAYYNSPNKESVWSFYSGPFFKFCLHQPHLHERQLIHDKTYTHIKYKFSIKIVVKENFNWYFTIKNHLPTLGFEPTTFRFVTFRTFQWFIQRRFFETSRDRLSPKPNFFLKCDQPNFFSEKKSWSSIGWEREKSWCSSTSTRTVLDKNWNFLKDGPTPASFSLGLSFHT